MKALLILCLALTGGNLHAQLVNYLGRQFQHKSLILLEAAGAPREFYYLPTRLLVVESEAGYALSLTKYTGTDEATPRGGLLNVAFTLTPPAAELRSAARFLERELPGATLRGLVPLRADRNGDEPVNYLISHVGDQAEVIALSKHPARVEGDQTIVGLTVDPPTATLLERSLGMASADLALVSRLYYSATSTDASLRVTAPTTTVLGKLLASGKEQLSERDVRRAAARLRAGRELRIEWFGGRAGVDSEQQEQLVDRIVTALLQRFLTPASTRDGMGYRVGDHVIREDSISLTVRTASTVRVPVLLVGQAGGIVTADNRSDYVHRVVLGERQQREVSFSISGGVLPDFPVDFSRVGVRFRGGAGVPLRPLDFRDDFQRTETVALPDTSTYEYQTSWQLPATQRTVTSDWLPVTWPAPVVLAPPLERTRVSLLRSEQPPPDLLRHVLVLNGQLGGQPTQLLSVSYRAEAALPENALEVYHDPGTPVTLELTTITRGYNGLEKQLKTITDDYLQIL